MCRMELAALHAIAHGFPDAQWLANRVLNGREPTEDQESALADVIDVALYLDERELGA